MTRSLRIIPTSCSIHWNARTRWWKRYSAELRTSFCITTTAFLLTSLLPGSAAAQLRMDWRALPWNDTYTSPPSSRFDIAPDSYHDPARQAFVLTDDAPGRAGRIFLRQEMLLDVFDARFDAWFGVNTPANRGGADGIVFLAARETGYPTTYGGDLNASGSGGYGVEFDTYYNPLTGDPSAQHIAVTSPPPGNHLGTALLPENTLEDGRWHSIRLSNRFGRFRVVLDGVERVVVDHPSFVAFRGFFGFAAATGDASNLHMIDNVSVSVPTRRADTLGVRSACGATDTTVLVVIRNNHPDVRPLTIADVRIAGDAGFTVLPAGLPLRCDPDSTITLRVRVTTPPPGTDGMTQAVLSVTEASGERIDDTLRMFFALPQGSFEQSVIALGRIPLGGVRDTVLTLRNTGIVPMRVDSITGWTRDVQPLRPFPWPTLLQPGSVLRIPVRCTPSVEGPIAATLRVSACGRMGAADILATGTVDTLVLALGDRPLMLVPGISATLPVILRSPPRGSGAREFEAEISVDAAIARITGAAAPYGTLFHGATLRLSRPAAGAIRVTVTDVPAELVDAGVLFHLLVDAVRTDTGCTVVSWRRAEWNPFSPVPGVPRALTGDGRSCINPSCRIPEGVMRLAPPRVQVYPNPFRHETVLGVVLLQDDVLTIEISDAAGRVFRPVEPMALTAGSHTIRIRADELPAGRLEAAVHGSSGTIRIPLVLLR